MMQWLIGKKKNTQLWTVIHLITVFSTIPVSREGLPIERPLGYVGKSSVVTVTLKQPLIYFSFPVST